MATMTYNGNKTYDAEFTNWFNNWFTEIEEEMDWECNISYVSDQQKEEIKPADISQNERDALLAKYGFKSTPTYTQPVASDPNAHLTFEEMCRREDERLAQERMRRHQQMMGPKPTTFGGQNGYDSEVKYGTDDDTGFGFKIEIVTDMKIPKY